MVRTNYKPKEKWRIEKKVKYIENSEDKVKQ